MALYKRGDIWWYSFSFAGKRIQESAKTSRRTFAVEAERNRRRELEQAVAGMPTNQQQRRVQSVEDVIAPYLEGYRLNHRPKSVRFAESRLAHVNRVLGGTLLIDLTEDVVRRYIATRLNEGVSGRTVNMELGELSRAIGKEWSQLWPRVRRLEERKDVGRALSREEQARLIAALELSESPLLPTIVRVAFMTGMRSGEILSLTWEQVDFGQQYLTVGRAKTASGTGRQIPLNAYLSEVLLQHRAWFVSQFGEPRPEHHLFPFGSPVPSDPCRHITDLKRAWTQLREHARVNCRFHDLRHTVATQLAEAGTPESTMLAALGHMSRAMLERYSHIRMEAKRKAFDCLSLAPASDAISTISTTVVGARRVQ
jgi:integrase